MNLNRIAAIDDDASNRASMADWIDNLFGAESVQLENAPVTTKSIADWVRECKIDAVIIDHKLTRNGYSLSNGLVIASELALLKIPTVLATSYERSEIKEYVWYGRDVPAVVRKGNYESELPSAMELAFGYVQGGVFTRETEPFPTIVRVDSLDEDEAGLIISAFSPEQGILVRRAELKVRLGCEIQIDLRFLAETNIGAASSDDLYLSNLRVVDQLDKEYAAMLRT